MTFSLFLALSAFLIALVGTRLLILAFRGKRMMLDVPSDRSNHTRPVPRGGGLAVLFAILIPLMVADIHFSLVLSLLILAAVSLLDDLITVPVWVRFLVQVIAVSIPLSLMPMDVFGGIFSPVVAKIIIGMLWIWFINLFNFMDGVDGLSAVEMISIGLGVALLMVFADRFPGAHAEYGMIIAASACGFWWWNKHPAKIFLGDVGSIPIGFIAGFLLLDMALAGFASAAIILPAYYIADTTVTLFKRLLKREKIWQAHSEHYYQRALRKGWSHHAVTIDIAGVNVLLGFLAIQSMLYPDLAPIFVALAYMAVFMLMGFFGHEQKTPH